MEFIYFLSLKSTLGMGNSENGVIIGNKDLIIEYIFI